MRSCGVCCVVTPLMSNSVCAGLGRALPRVPADGGYGGDHVSVSRTLCGALIFPSVANLVGRLMFRRVTSNLQRTILVSRGGGGAGRHVMSDLKAVCMSVCLSGRLLLLLLFWGSSSEAFGALAYREALPLLWSKDCWRYISSNSSTSSRPTGTSWTTRLGRPGRMITARKTMRTAGMSRDKRASSTQSPPAPLPLPSAGKTRPPLHHKQSWNCFIAVSLLLNVKAHQKW